MDAVYVLGTGSPRNNLELLFSLRSLQLHMKDLRKVFVIGERPPWIENIIHIPFPDRNDDGWKNIHEKILEACKLPTLSEDFLLMNDDFMMLKDFNGSDYPFYAKKGEDGGMNGQYNFRIHAPIKINKKMYSQFPLNINMKGAWSPRTFYANFFKAPPTFCNDFNFRVSDNASAMSLQLDSMDHVALGAFDIKNDILVELLNTKYDFFSKFENVVHESYPVKSLF